jgi:hypothetical protein
MVLPTLVFILAQDRSAWSPETAIARYGLKSYTSHDGAVSFAAELLLIRVDVRRLEGTPEAEDLQKNWSLRFDGLDKIPKRGVPLGDNALVRRQGNTLQIVVAFPSCRMQVYMNTRREVIQSYDPFPPLPANAEAMAEAILRESYARYVGWKLAAAPGINLAGQSMTRRKNPNSGAEYIPLRTFAQAVGATINENDETLRFTLNRGSRVFQFAWGAPYAKMGGRWEKLPDGVALRDGQLWIPVAAAQRFVSRSGE